MKCSIYRWKITRTQDRGVPPGPGTSNHLATCAACRSFARRQATLAEALSASTPTFPEPSAGYHRHIMASLRDEGAQSVPTISHALRPSLVAVALLVAAFGLSLTLVHLRQNRNARLAEAGGTLAAYPASVLALPQDAPVMVTEPIAQEADLLKQDLRQAAAFLLARLD